MSNPRGHDIQFAPALEVPEVDPRLLERANAAAEAEKALTLKQSLRTYWKAAFWSMCLSFALVMEGYDLGIINSFWGHGAFLRKFGSVAPDGTLYIPANWQAALNNAASIGQIVGLAINGFAQPRFGSRKTYLAAMALMIAMIFLPVFAQNLPMLFGGALLCGIPWGVFQTLTTAYAAEICPLQLRGFLSAFVNMCWGFGLLLSAGVVRASITIDSNWGWRMPYALQWVWPVPLFILAWFAPESPWWCVKAGKYDLAKKNLARITPRSYMSNERMEEQIAMMQHTINLEKKETVGASYVDCFRGTNARRTEIVMAVWIFQYFCGQNIINYATQYLQDGGLSETAAFNLNLVTNVAYIIGTIGCWVIMYYAGRRTTYMWGFVVMGAWQLVVGALGFVGTVNATLAIGAIMVVINMTFNCSLGPVCYTIAAEIPATRLRSKTLVLGRGVYLISSIICNQITPRMFSVTEWNWGARCGLFWMGFNILAAVYMFFRLPESKGRLYGELDILFQNRVSARKFSSTVIDNLEHSRDAAQAPDLGEKGDFKADVAHVEH